MNSQIWKRYQEHLNVNETVGITLDISHMKFSDDFFESMQEPMDRAFEAMKNLESGVIANPDENRMVGHYWLRNASLAPNDSLRQAITETLEKVQSFAKAIHSGAIKNPQGQAFRKILLVGIGGSALGPQFVYEALGCYRNAMDFHVFDNTDPDGMDLVIGQIGQALSETLTVVISKSGGTKETRNGMLEAKAAYTRAGLDFSKHVVAVTGEGSPLEGVAKGEGWLEIFPMWDWVGGRTSELSAVGLLPAALQGIDIQKLLEGAAQMDEITRQPTVKQNPAALLALMWHYAGNGKGEKDMVILPYKDRLSYLSRYLQQLIMESIGKEKDLEGNTVNQGIVVYGNKGSTDQHAYVQQLREGLSGFFATFLQVLNERDGETMEVESSITTGDYLQGFLLGTESALYENDRESMTLTLTEVNESTVGALIALYERAVGFYATLVGINAYHQPGVEAGKKAAGLVLDVQVQILNYLKSQSGIALTVDAISDGIGKAGEELTVYKILEYLAHNNRLRKEIGADAFSGKYSSLS